MAERFSYSFNDPDLTIKITGGTWGAYYRIFVRYADDPSSRFYSDDVYCPQSGKISVTITLDPDEKYAFNAGKVENGSTSWYWKTGPVVTTGSGGDPDPPRPQRPDDWVWWNPIYKGAEIRLEANEWNAFCERINEFREYTGLSSYRFSLARRGDNISASIVNEAVDAISDMVYCRYLTVGTGTIIQSEFFLSLQNELNSIR